MEVLFKIQQVSTENILNRDFALYSSVEDAEADTNRWQYCNYADGWVLGALDSLTCPVGYSRVFEKEDCQDAAEAWGFGFADQSHRDDHKQYPRGCYKRGSVTSML